VLTLRARYECANEQASADARPEKRARTKERLERERQERIAAQAKARSEYEAGLRRLHDEIFAAAREGREAFDEVAGRLRAHYAKPPWRVIGKHVVCDAVQLTEPLLLLNLLVDRVSSRVADAAESAAQRGQQNGKAERRNRDGVPQNTRDGGSCEVIARRVATKRAGLEAEKAEEEAQRAAKRARKSAASKKTEEKKAAAEEARAERVRGADAELHDKHQPATVLRHLLKLRQAGGEGLAGLPFVQQHSLLRYYGGSRVAKPTRVTAAAVELEWRALVAAQLGDVDEGDGVGAHPPVGPDAVRRLFSRLVRPGIY
jgi:hypothetical protein